MIKKTSYHIVNLLLQLWIEKQLISMINVLIFY